MPPGSHHDVAREVRLAIVEILRDHGAEKTLRDELELCDGGLGLDSVSMAELLVVLGERLGVSFAELLERPTAATVGDLVLHARAAAR